MQTTNQPSSQSAKSNPFVRILAIIGGLVVAFCICGILGVAFMRLLGRSAADAANQKVIVPTAVVQPVASQPVVGATIQFISPTETKAPVATATPALGKTRDHPLPMDAVVDIGSDMQMSIVFVTRPADDIVKQGNPFNDTPEPNQQEYIMVALHVDCKKASNEKCNFDSAQVKTVGANGTVQNRASVAGVPHEMEYFTEFFGGSAIEGNLVFLVTKNDSSTVLFYDPLIFGEPLYIALQK